MIQNKGTSQNEKAKIAESYNNLYALFSSHELREVGNYTIIRLIGEGSFGKVYLANNKLTHTKVVLKTGAKDDPNLVREVYYHRQFVHPNITRLYEVIISEGLIWMVLEYCSGKELYDYVLSVGRVPVDEVRKLFSQITAAVYYAHSLNCIHRDLKLENVLLDKKRNAKLSDFGFTRECEAKSLLETICGTTVYMAPELINKNKYDGFKVDVWSLGVILFTLLYGEMPFDEDDDLKTKAKIINEEPEYRDDIPDEAIHLIIWLLEKDPKQRPSTRDILLHPFLDGSGSPILETTDTLVKSLINQKFFQSKTEKHLLKKLKSLGIDIHQLQNSVVSRNCDSLAGLWELLLERQKKKEWKKYKARSRSTVLRITESTSRRVSQLMEPISSPPISRMVSIKSSMTNNNYNPSIYSNQTANIVNNRSCLPNKQIEQNGSGAHDTQPQHMNESISAVDSRKKNGLINRISKFFKIHNKNEGQCNGSSTNSLVSRPSFNNSIKSSASTNVNSTDNNNNLKHNNNSNSHTDNPIITQNLQSVSFNNNVLRPQNITHDDNRSPSPTMPIKPTQESLDTSGNTTKLGTNGSVQPQQLTIKEPNSPLRFMSNHNGSSSAKKANIPRPASMVSQHSLISQYTMTSDISLNSSQSESTTTRPSNVRGISSDTTHSRSARRSLSLISSNSSTSSSRKNSFYDQGSSTTSGVGSSFKFLTTASSNMFNSNLKRGKKYNETAVFPKSFSAASLGYGGRSRKSPLSTGGLLPSSRFHRKSKNLIIEEEEYDDIDCEDIEEEEVVNNLNGLDINDNGNAGDDEDDGGNISDQQVLEDHHDEDSHVVKLANI